MRRRNLLLVLLTTLIATTTITIQTPTTTAQQKASIAVSPIVIDTRNLKQIGDTFSINVTIANVHKLWGYQYSLLFNASVIAAINYEKLDERFTLEPIAPDIGNDYIALARGTYNGDPDGVTTVDPIPVDRIEFVVTGNGTTTLTFDPEWAEFSDVTAFTVYPIVVGGKFSNTQILELHNVAVTEASVSKTTAAPGDTIDIDAVITNKGGFTENVTVTAMYDETQIGDPQTITNLQIGSNQTLSFTWDTAGLDKGDYVVTVEATIETDDDMSDNTYTAGTVTLETTGGGLPIDPIYIGAGIGILVIVIIAVYALRARRSK